MYTLAALRSHYLRIVVRVLPVKLETLTLFECRKTQ
jgi:hypothetical protein